MKKKIFAIAFCSALLTACASPKYKISDQDVKNYIGMTKGVVQCVNPNVTNSTSYQLLPDAERTLFDNYEYNILAQTIGGREYSIMKSDPKSWNYFLQKVNAFKNNVKARLLTVEQCNAYKAKFASDLAAIQQKNAEQAQLNQQKQAEQNAARQAAEAYRQQYLNARMQYILRRASGNLTPSEVALETAKRQQMQQSIYQQNQLDLQREQLNMQQQQNQALLEMQQRQHEERMRMMQNNQNRSYDVSCNNYGGYTTRCEVR